MLRRFDKDEPITEAAFRAKLNEMVDAILAANNLSVGAGMYCHSSPMGKMIGINSITPNTVVVKVTSDATGGGKYNGRIVKGVSNAVATGNLAMPEGLTVPSSDNCLVVNPIETALGTHDIDANVYRVGVVVGRSTTSPYLPIVMLTVLTENPLFPVNLSQVGGSNGSSSAAATYTYNVTTLGGDSIGSAMAVSTPRASVGEVSAASKGTAYRTGAGTLVLYQAFEVFTVTTSCP